MGKMLLVSCLGVLQVLVTGVVADSIEPMSPVTVTEGRPFNLTCLVNLTKEPIGINLEKTVPAAKDVTIFQLKTPFSPKGGDLVNDERFSVTRIGKHSFTITVARAKLEDAARYRCVLIGYREVKEMTTVVVLGKPSVGITGNLIAGEESRQLQLRCDVLYAVPADLSRTADADRFPNLTARIGDVELPGTQLELSKRNLTLVLLPALAPSDNGEDLICTVSTKRPPHHAEGRRSLNVLYAVRDLTVSPEKPVYSVGEVVDCAAAGNPEPSLEWTTGSNGSHTSFGRSLHIIEEMVGSPQEWTCLASNTLPRPSGGTQPYRLVVAKTITFTVAAGSSSLHLSLALADIVFVCVFICV